MTNRSRTTILIISLALVAAIAVALSWQPIAGWLRPAPPSPPEKLTIGVGDVVGSALVRLAAARDFFSAEGLAVTLQPHTSGKGALDAVIANQADIATVADLPIVFATLKKIPLAIVATIAATRYAEGVLARRDRGVAAPADLRGKTIGVPFGTSSHFLLSAVLASNGIAMNQVHVRDIKPEALAPALAAGGLDAIAAWGPWLSQAIEATGANGLTIYAVGGLGYQFHLVGQRGFVRDHPAAMQRLLRALARAESYLREQAQAAHAAIAASAQHNPAALENLWPKYELRVTLSQALLNTLEDQARWAIASGFAETRAVPNFLDAIYLDAMLAVKPQAVSIVR